MTAPISLVCAGCGFILPPLTPRPFRCPQAAPGDDTDHVVRRVIDPARWAAAETVGRAPERGAADADATNPFLRYRHRLYAHQVAVEHGLGDDGFVGLVRRLDEAVASVDGRGFRETPFEPERRLSASLGFGEGGLWVKNETGNVAGSHKGRHLGGLMLFLEVWRHLRARGAVPGGGASAGGEPERPRLAIASCGNAALAAGVVARAAGWPLDVFVPHAAEPSVLERLHGLGARIATCPRLPRERGDPCYRCFHEAVDAGALAFCVQGPDNGLTVEGGQTIAYEMLDRLGPVALDRVFVQVGGGALASSLAEAFAEAHAAGVLRRLPRLHPVQTASAFPLKRAYDRVVARVLGLSVDALGETGATAAHADAIVDSVPAAWVRRVLGEAAHHRSAYMWPWETAPHSLAHGILDDETYDWLAIVEGMLASGGWPVVVSEEDLARANARASSETGIDVCHTGSAGLAGVLHLLDASGTLAERLRGERVAVLFSGIRRG